MSRTVQIIIVTILAALVVIGGFFGLWATYTQSGRIFINNYRHGLQKADDKSLYETRKKVEDECHAMIVTYESKKSIWEQNKNSDDTFYKDLANAAKITANQTASKYNNYILKNNYVWKDNVPEDIFKKLEILE